MNKLTKLLSVFLIAGVVGTGAAGIAACSKPDDGKHTHTAGNTWEHDENDHYHLCTADDGEKMDKEAHKDDNKDGKCDVCDYTMTTPAQDLQIEANTTGLKVEGVTTEFNLSNSATSATVSTSAMKVYLDNQGTKGKEVPAANYKAELYDGTTKLTEWSGLKKDGTYTLVVTLTNAKKADGTAVEADSIYKEVTITVHNAITTIALKAGTTTQTQGADVMKDTWTFEATRANGEKFDVNKADVTVGTLDTNSVGTRTVSITYGTVNGTVEYTITADANSHTTSYAINFADSAVGNVATNAEFKQGEKVVAKNLATGAKIESTTQTYDDETANEHRTFTNRFKFGGGTIKSDGALHANNRMLEITTDGAASITVFYYTSNDGRGIALYNTASITGDTTPIASDTTTKAAGVKKYAMQVSSAGTYYLANKGGDMYFLYIQVDNLISGQGTSVALPTATETQDIKLTVENKIGEGEAAKDRAFKVGDKFASWVTALKEVVVNPVTREFTETLVSDFSSATYKITKNGATEPVAITTADSLTADMLGKQTVTVTYNAHSATYSVVVESAVSGVTGATVSVKSTVNKEVTDDAGKVTLNYSDIEAQLVGTNSTATASVTSLKYRLSTAEAGTETAIPSGGSVQLGKGSYVIIAEVTVTDGTGADQKTAQFTAETNFAVTKKVVGELVTLATYNVGLASGAITNDSNGKVTVTNNGTMLDNNNYKFDNSDDTLDIAVTGLKAGQQVQVTLNCKSGSNDKTVTFTLTASGAATGTTTSAALATDYADVAAGTYNVASDGTVTLTIVRGGATLRLASVKIEVKGVAA